MTKELSCFKDFFSSRFHSLATYKEKGEKKVSNEAEKNYNEHKMFAKGRQSFFDLFTMIRGVHDSCI